MHPSSRKTDVLHVPKSIPGSRIITFPAPDLMAPAQRE
ncbi:hypothetical protein JTE90_028234, partial [Oedothorax gibbosus]